MKNLIIVLFALLIAPSCIAQSKLTSGKFNINGVFFNVRQSTNGDRTNYIVSVEGKYSIGYPEPKIPNALTVYKDEVHFNMEQLKNIFYDKVAYKRDQLSEAKGYISFSISFEEDGSVARTNYIISGKTDISLKEIAEIDKQIKTTIKATFTGPTYVNWYVITYPSISIRF